MQNNALFLHSALHHKNDGWQYLGKELSEPRCCQSEQNFNTVTDFRKKMKTKIGYFVKENLKHKLLIRIPVAVASDTGKVDKYEKGALRWVCQNVFN